MNKTLILALAVSASFATLAGGTAALAQGGPMRDRDMTREQAETRAATSFARMDANGDGLLNEADGEARQRARFDRVDSDGNGSLSFEEFAAIRENIAERRGQRGERRDDRRGERAQRGGRPGGDRMAMGGRRGGGGPNLAALMRQNADTDGDGAISQAEYTAAALTRFQRQDADGDGTVTAAERRAHRMAMREVRAAHRAQNRARNAE